MLFARGLQLVSRPGHGVFTIYDLYQLYLPLIGFELVSSAQFFYEIACCNCCKQGVESGKVVWI